MMKFTPALVACLLIVGTAQASEHPVEPLAGLPNAVKELRMKALSGNYQAMRNLGYAYSAGFTPASGNAAPKRLPIAGCAWYLLIPWLNPAETTSGDTGNIHLYCGRLSPDQLDTAYRHAIGVRAQMAKRKA